jgi:hypothetical protein
MPEFIKGHELEGAVAKRSDSVTTLASKRDCGASIGSTWGRDLESAGTF